MLLLIDNYDSFTHNLVQRIGEVDPALPIEVVRNDAITIAQIERLAPTHIVISPGPCTPREAGISNEVARVLGGRIPLLGVCLGQQCIASAAGATIARANRLMHGKTSLIRHDNSPIFAGMPNPFAAARYHSLIVRPGTLPNDLLVAAVSADDESEIMALRHRCRPVFGVQFHPESFMTPEGHLLLANFLGIGYSYRA